MKFSCNQQALARALNIVSKAVTSRTTMPILKGILLEVTGEHSLKMSASDLDITIEEVIDIEYGEPGSIVVQAKLFGDIIRKLPNYSVNISVEDEKVIVKCLNSCFEIVGFSSDEFPNIVHSNNNEEFIVLDKNLLKDMIRKTSFAASIDESKGIITGILIELIDGRINLVAIDGYRMAITREYLPETVKKNVVISAKIMNEINKILSEVDEETVKLELGNDKVIITIGEITVVLRILEGDFIRYKDVIPKESKIRVKADKNVLLDSIERASLLSKEGKNNLIKLSMEDGLMTITSKSEEGNVTENLEIEKDGEDLDIGFNAKYILDVLKSIDDEEIVMLFNTGITPCLVRPVEGDKFEYLVLPVRLANN